MSTIDHNKETHEVSRVFTSNAQQTTTVVDGETIIELNDVTIRFNKNNLKVDNLKEYFIRLVTKQLMFQEFIALRNINLKIKKGEAWGFVGTNGAGKSTLLKVVSRILKPSMGSVKVSGTVAALIELGAGIDPQLTARENIFLNGTLLGYSKEFIESKFDEIVEFSELQEFLDSPVKNFSSGMKTRLAFSIATAVEPDILIADEILAVGDLKFRKKCNAKMDEMLKGGTTLLYVSHNIASVKKQCSKAMWLDHGNIIMVGDSAKVCDAFQKEMESPVPIILGGARDGGPVDPDTVMEPVINTLADAEIIADAAKKAAAEAEKKAASAKKTAAAAAKKAEAAKKAAEEAEKKAEEMAEAEHHEKVEAGAETESGKADASAESDSAEEKAETANVDNKAVNVDNEAEKPQE